MALTAVEVQTILGEALRAREPVAGADPPAGPAVRPRVSVLSVVDSNGVILGIVRSRDAPVFGIDVVAAEGAHGGVLFVRRRGSASAACRPQPISTAASWCCARSRCRNTSLPRRRFLGLPTRARRWRGRLLRPRRRQPVAAVFPGRRQRQSRTVRSANRRASGARSPPGCSSIWSTTRSCSTWLRARAGRRTCRRTVPVSTASTTASHSRASIPQLANGTQIFPGSVPIYRGAHWSAASACPATASTRTT